MNLITMKFIPTHPTPNIEVCYYDNNLYTVRHSSNVDEDFSEKKPRLAAGEGNEEIKCVGGKAQKEELEVDDIKSNTPLGLVAYSSDSSDEGD